MAYAEKRGKGPAPWRVKYRLPSGIETSESGFETKAAALTWGRDQEARIREGRWTDPNAGKLTVGEWIDRWLAIQDVGISTVDNREYLSGASSARPGTKRHCTRSAPRRSPAGRTPSPPGQESPGGRHGRPAPCSAPSWATRPPPGRRSSPTTRRSALVTAAAGPGAGSSVSPQRVWATPLEALLIAERAALLSGRDEDFTMIVRSATPGCGGASGRAGASTCIPADPRRMAAPRNQRPVPSAAAQGRLLSQPPLGTVPSRRPARVPGRLAEPPGRGQSQQRCPVPPSMAAAASMSSSAWTAVTADAATTHGACSAPPATDDISQGRAVPPG